MMPSATLIGGSVMLTAGVAALSEGEQATILCLVRTFNAFTADNDPYGEHDFGVVRHNGNKFFWKIDYYDPPMRYGSEDPSDPDVTRRVLTIMFANEY